MHHLLSGLIGLVVGVVAAGIVGDGRRSAMLDAVAGMCGAMPGAWFLMPLSSSGVADRLLNTAEAGGAVVGAVFALALWILFRPGDR